MLAKATEIKTNAFERIVVFKAQITREDVALVLITKWRNSRSGLAGSYLFPLFILYLSCFITPIISNSLRTRAH